MALNWQYIKGFNGTSNSLLYSWIQFATPGGDLTTKAPEILVREDFNDPSTGTTNLGQILCSRINNKITGSFSWYSPTAGGPWYYEGLTTISGSSPYWMLQAYTITGYPTIKFNGAILDIDAPTKVHVRGNSYFHSDVSITGSAGLHVGGSISSRSYMKTPSYMEALYFNATSDKRAKIHIKPVTDSVLQIVKQMQLYTYIYKDTQTPSIGMLAQDMNWTINGFDFVQNREATGRKGDYMTVHESKLVFVLWKAVQELAQEVEELKKKLGE